jgi:hypothetical protein
VAGGQLNQQRRPQVGPARRLQPLAVQSLIRDDYKTSPWEYSTASKHQLTCGWRACRTLRERSWVLSNTRNEGWPRVRRTTRSRIRQLARTDTCPAVRPARAHRLLRCPGHARALRSLRRKASEREARNRQIALRANRPSRQRWIDRDRLNSGVHEQQHRHPELCPAPPDAMEHIARGGGRPLDRPEQHERLPRLPRLARERLPQARHRLEEPNLGHRFVPAGDLQVRVPSAG